MTEGGVPHYTEWTPRLIRRSKYEYEDESRETSTIMDLLGYGPVIRQIRRDAYNEWDRIFNTWTYGQVLLIISGGKAEGLSCIFESDIDTIYISHNIMYPEECIAQSTIPGHITLFNMNLQRTSAGYCRLLLGRQTLRNPTYIINSLCDAGHGNSKLSSTLYLEQFEDCQLSLGMVSLVLDGPSLPISNGELTIDVVPAIHCHCPVILRSWAKRPRHWPPPDVVEKVVAMGAFVTPIGYKGSAYNHVDRRICFNTAETELVNNLNDTQIKIYVILKMIVNDIVKPQTTEITSYILKNTVL